MAADFFLLAVSDQVGTRVGGRLAAERAGGVDDFAVRAAGGDAGIAADVFHFPVDAGGAAPVARAGGVGGEFPAARAPGKADFHFLDVALVDLAQGADGGRPFVAVKAFDRPRAAVHVEGGDHVFFVGARVVAENIVAVALAPAGYGAIGHRFRHGADDGFDNLMAHAHRRSADGGRILGVQDGARRGG